MIKKAFFKVMITDEDRIEFAKKSGDYNPLHVDDVYASNTEFKSCVLHGAFSAGLVSRMAGMYLPGKECLLHSIKLKFIRPIITPVEVVVSGHITRDDGVNGSVDVEIREAKSDALLVESAYQFGRHSYKAKVSRKLINNSDIGSFSSGVVVTGATGGLGSALITLLEHRGVSLSHNDIVALASMQEEGRSDLQAKFCKIESIVHCAWPKPSNDELIKLDNIQQQIDYHIAKPLLDCIMLARILKMHGLPGSSLILIGSSFSVAGRHGWRMPLYSLSKSMVPVLVNILALELANTGHKVFGVIFDVVDCGMNSSMSHATRQAHEDRTLTGKLPTADEVAKYIAWLIDNPGNLISGGMIDLTGGALP